MPSRSKRLCVFGDSHIGSLRKALDAGLIKSAGFEIEFWGATGPQFRQIDIIDGVVRPTSPQAAEMVAQVNGQGREALEPGDFDIYLFFGARLRMADFMPPYLQRLRDPQNGISAAVLQAGARGFLADRRMARIARNFGTSGKSRVFFAPAPLWTWGIQDNAAAQKLADDYPLAVDAGKTDRDMIWAVFQQIFEPDGVTLLRQPEETVTRGIFTDPKYAVEGAQDSGDIGHKSAEYAALVFKSFLKAAK